MDAIQPYAPVGLSAVKMKNPERSDFIMALLIAGLVLCLLLVGMY